MLWALVGVVRVAGIAGVAGVSARVASSRPVKPQVTVEVSNAFVAFDTHLGAWCASIDATNAGGLAVTVSGFGYRLPSGDDLVATAVELGSTPLPHRLEPQARASFLMRAQGILDECAIRGIHASELKSWVRLQTGTTIFGAAPPIAPG